MARQRECFPRLDLVAAKSAMNHLKALVCVFSMGRRMVGQLFVVDLKDEFITINYTFAATSETRCIETEAALRTIEVTSSIDRRLFLCPTCSRRRRDLYYLQSWACIDCHCLLYRSQLVDKEVKLWEERDQLQTLLKSGRPKGMHNSTYFEHRLRLAELERRLHGRPRKEASAEHNAIITEQWVPARDIDFWSSRYSVREGGFVRFEH